MCVINSSKLRVTQDSSVGTAVCVSVNMTGVTADPAVLTLPEAHIAGWEERTSYVSKNIFLHFLYPCSFFLHLSLHLQWEGLRCEEKMQVRETWIQLRKLRCTHYITYNSCRGHYVNETARPLDKRNIQNAEWSITVDVHLGLGSEQNVFPL